VKILGIDTSTDFLHIGLYDQGKVYEYSLETKKKLSGVLDVTIKRLLDAVGWSFSDIDYFACGAGPGSFTGIRVGIAAVKGMSWALSKPVVAVSSLDILAKNCATEGVKIVPVIDARRGLVYCALYVTKNGCLKRTSKYLLISVKELCKLVKTRAVFLGCGALLYRQEIAKSVRRAEILDRDYNQLRPHNIINLALEKIRAKAVQDTFTVQPIYLYPRDCQVKKK
jgi:tRNA threonylcarbamoyladenosine biosynthesis protein TsaB